MGITPILSKLSWKGMRGRVLLLTLLACTTLQAATLQQVSVTGKSMSLVQAIQQIEEHSDYRFVYKTEDLNMGKRNIECHGSIDEVLNTLLKGTGITYSVNGNKVMLKKIAATQQQQPKKKRVITGIVLDASQNNEPVIGATVKLRNSTIGTVTDANGRYSITVEGTGGVLEFSFIGMKRQAMTIGSQNVINVTMDTDSQTLDDVVVVGFGKQKKESVVGAVQTIKPAELRVPSSSLSTAFAGKLAGVVSVQRSGEPGADGANFWIRGISTFGGGSTPLIFIDGVEVSIGDLNALPPEVIENFSVLKDAAATALYGSRGASGVMLVTTRQGKSSERAKINIRVEGQMTQPTKTIELADGVDYMRMFNEAVLTRNPNTSVANLPFSQSKIQHTAAGGDPLIYPNVNWQDVLFKNASYNQTVNLNVTGGGSKVTYFLNATFNNDNGMLKSDPQNKFNNNIRQQRYSLQGNIVADLTKTTKVAVRLNTQILSYGGSRYSTGDLYSEMFNSPGVLFPAYYPDMDEDVIRFGNKYGGPNPQDGGVPLYHNPYAQMVSGYKERSENTTIASFDISQNLKFITQGLTIKGLISFKNWTSTSITRDFQPTFYEVDPDKIAANPDLTYSPDVIKPKLNVGRNALNTSTDSSGDRLMNIQLSLDYARTFGRHDVSGLLVYLQRNYNNNKPSGFRDSLPNRYQGLSGRFTYGYDGRYLAEINLGYTGSENFEKGNRFGLFPAFALGYNISREAFWKPLESVISNLKLRGSWGIVGNSSINGSRFPYLTEVDLSGASFQFGSVDSHTSMSGATITKYGAVGAHWEKGKKLNIGLDLELFRSLSITADVYREIRDGIFMQYRTIPTESGILGDNRPYANIGKVRNKGIDLTVDYNKAFLNNKLFVNVKGTFTYAKNTLLDRDEPPYDEANRYQSEIGKSLNVSKGYVADGLYSESDFIKDANGEYILKPELPSSSYDVLPGDIKYKDLNGDGKIDGNDQGLIGNPTNPEIVYGFGASATYKGLDVSIFFQGVGNTSLMMSDIHPFGAQYTALYQFIADDYWSESNPNPNAAYPRLVQGVSDHNNFKSSTYWLRNGAFMRLKNVEIGYTYKFARIYLSGQNLLTFSKFKNWDPEIGGGRGLSYPPLRIYSLGFQFTF